MPLPLDLLAFGINESRRQRPVAYTSGERVPLARTGRIVRRCWRRSQAEKAAHAYREAGYAVVVSEEPRAWSLHEWGHYAVVVSGKTL